MSQELRRLYLVLGDQLDPASSVFADFDADHDALWMAEVAEEATHVWSHKARIALFLSAMRHYALGMRESGRRVHYRRLGEHDAGSLPEALAKDLQALRPQSVVLVEPGDWRVREHLHQALNESGLPWEELPDPHFLVSLEAFSEWAQGRREFRLEHFYRHFRKRLGVLMDGDQPVGGRWNFDAANRGSFDARGPGLLPQPIRFDPDSTTREVLELVQSRWPDHPGELENFDWPVTPTQAQAALEDFIAHRLVAFGRYQDALWRGEPWLYHSRISSSLNLKLIDPRSVIAAAIDAWEQGGAPIEAVEGFVRQILGWREYVRGLYWQRMPDYLADNALGADEPLPSIYWTGETPMRCLADALQQTLRLGYAHHIQRLMVTGLFALLLGVRPRELHEWYLAVYVDAVEWVELPNTIGMSQYADGGFMASKPYCASGKYIQRMGNYCAGCAFDPAEATGPKACPYTTLYWDFLIRHESRFARHPRTALQWKHLARMSAGKRQAIEQQAEQLRASLRAQG
ncbi:MAG: cryptochrome/photolyase family protein [Xanthomonadales bacterium]|nr:cryptochrome/photolyase family protein [Xanthomonadales bacterium]